MAASGSAIKSRQEWGKFVCKKPTTTFLWWFQACKQPSTRPNALGDRKPAQVCGRHERRVETELPEWLETIHGRIDGEDLQVLADVLSSLRGHTTSSNSFIPASSRKTFFKQIRKKAQFVHSLKKKTELRSMQTHESLRRRHAKINPDDRADRIKIVERLGDILTADHKVLNEDQESTLHHKCAVVVQDLANQWLQKLSMHKPKSAQEDDEKSSRYSWIQKKIRDPLIRTIL